MKFSEQEIKEALAVMVEEGTIVVVGYNKDGEPLYATKKWAEENNVDTNSKLN